jgi:hypothetical protein
MLRKKSIKTGVRVLTIFVFILLADSSVSFAVYDDVDWLPETEDWLPETGGNVAFMTKYVWRGWLLDEEPVMQFDTYMSKWGFTLDVWGNYSLNNDKAKNFGRYEELTELDYTISYNFTIGDMGEKLGVDTPGLLDPFGISAGYIFYTFPNLDFNEKGSYTHEAFLACSYDAFLQPFFKWYWDVEAARGSYLQFGGGHTFEFDGGISASLGLAFAYNYEQWTDESGWSDMLLSADVSMPILKYFTVTPSVAYSVILDRDTFNDTQENEFYGGITFAFDY